MWTVGNTFMHFTAAQPVRRWKIFLKSWGWLIRYNQEVNMNPKLPCLKKCLQNMTETFSKKIRDIFSLSPNKHTLLVVCVRTMKHKSCHPQSHKEYNADVNWSPVVRVDSLHRQTVREMRRKPKVQMTFNWQVLVIFTNLLFKCFGNMIQLYRWKTTTNDPINSEVLKIISNPKITGLFHEFFFSPSLRRSGMTRVAVA